MSYLKRYIYIVNYDCTEFYGYFNIRPLPDDRISLTLGWDHLVINEIYSV